MNSEREQFAQELLSTFSTCLGEVALIPSSGGVFTVTIFHSGVGVTTAGTDGQTEEKVIWDRKRDGGFPGLFLASIHPCSVVIGMLTDSLLRNQNA